MNRYFLIGLPGCGKTTLGKIASTPLNLTFIDLDKEIENREKKTCRALFLEEGELAFRKKEHQALKNLSNRDNILVALGGGTLNTSENRKLIKELGTLIYLQEEPTIIWKRLINKGIPAYLDKKDPKGSFLTLAENRLPIFEEAADRILKLKQRAPRVVLEELINGFKCLWNPI